MALGPELSIEGEIRGDISLLEEKGEAVIAVANPIQIGDTSHTYIRNVPVDAGLP